MRKLLLVVLLVGCGGSEGEPIGPAPGTGGTTVPPASALVGSWIAKLSDECLLAEAFDAEGHYDQSVLCTESSGRNDLDSEKGTYWEDPAAGRLYFTAQQATCSLTQKTYYDEYSVTRGTSLVLTTAASVIVLGFNPPSSVGTGAVLTLGCISGGAFTPGPLMPVP